MFEIDIGAPWRSLQRVRVVEHTSSRPGSLDDASFAGQERGASNFYGGRCALLDDPTGIGFLMEIALGYRSQGVLDDGTKLSMTDGWLDAHIGLGADVR